MAEPRTAAPPGVAATGQDVVLATKLHLPRPQPGLIPRPRLVEALGHGLAGSLTLLCAPAGFGKTALLADWVRREGKPAAWLSLDAGDNDPVRFWRHAAAALDRVLPGTSARLGPLLGPPAPPSFEGPVTALVNELADRPGEDELLLVLDDYHLLGSRPVHMSLGFLLEHLPPSLHLVLATRADPPLPLARLRARGQLTELRAADLRFTAGEAAPLVRQAAGADLPADSVAALTARTEGWAAGLQLAGLSLRGKQDPAGFVAAFSGSHRYVLDYLAGEVLERQPGEVRAFLLETSVLDPLSGELCDAVTGRTVSQAMLETIERAGLFLMPLDDVRGWWRYHQLFADLLRARLRQEQPARVARLHRNAAAWCEEHGLADDAVQHAVAAGDANWAARLIEQHFDTVCVSRGETATTQRWLSALPADLVSSRPRLLLAQAFLAAHSGGAEEVERSVDAAERMAADVAGEPFEPAAGRAGSLLVNVPAHIALCRSYLAYLRGDAEGVARFASRALAELGEGERMLDLAIRANLALAEWLRGRLAEAERALVSRIAWWRTAGEPTVAIWGDVYELSQVQLARGRLDEADRTCQRALEISTAGRPSVTAAGPAHVGLGQAAYQRDDLDAALHHVSEGVALCRQLAYTPPLATGLATLAWIRQATGDPAGALDAIGQAMRAAPGPPGLLNPVQAQRARLLLAHGDLAAAARWAEERGLGADDQPDYVREPEHLVLARVLITQGQPAQALALLDRLHAAAVTQDRTGSVIETGALRALALAACGDEAGAVAALAEALTLACPHGYVRIFADEGAAMGALLDRLADAQRAGHGEAAGVPPDCVAQIQAAFEPRRAAPGTGTGAPAATPGLTEPLTARELDVLRLLAAGKTNQRIARELVVALDTVKKHVSHVLAKLGAANRTEAVARAREFGLIP
jgi:LuxR family maltose regulon positive regulatory protein